jgi:sigma-B regulation protein RsbU (phosphoserine phosphatase)
MIASRIHKPKLNVRAKILAVFLALSVISLLITGFVALTTISDVGSYAQQSSTILGKEAIADSTRALQDSTEVYLIRIASDQAEIIDDILWSSEEELDILAEYALSAQNNPAYQSQIPSYSSTDPPQDPLSGTGVLLAPGATASAGSEEYSALAGMDDLLAAVYRTDGDLTSVYVVSESGIMRLYPWQEISGPVFDPRTRPWYVAAKASDHAVWTGPYVDAAGNGLILTCSRSVKTRYGTWVFASDATIDQINAYTNLTLEGKGYSVIVDNNGKIVSRPGLSANGARWDQPYAGENAFLVDNSDFSAVSRNMTAGKTGVERVLFNNNETFVAYAPISSLNWSYSVSMPASEIVAPIMVTEGKILSSTRAADIHISEQTERIRNLFMGLFCLLLIVVILLAWQLARIITRPVDALKEGATALGRGDLSARVWIHSGDEFEDLACSFNRMASDLRKNIENLKRTTAEKERYTKELEIAKEIQGTFLPESVPEIPGFEIAAVTTPAMEIGGDLYDFIPVSGNRQGFVIADVSGKGISAALFMAVSHTLLHASSMAEPDPSRSVRNANRLIYEDGRSSMFITVFYGVLDPKTLEFTYVNAGHNPPLLFRNGEAGIWMTDAKGIAMGVVPDVDISPATVRFGHGDLLVLYTDGVTEAFNVKDEPFGEERLIACIDKNRALAAEDILTALLEEIRQFSGAAPQSDDITLMVICVK